MAHKSFIAVNLFMKSATYLNVYLRQLYIHTNFALYLSYCLVSM